MTNLELLDAVKKSCEAILSNFKLRNAKNEDSHINIYTQNLPRKKEKNDTSQYPYVLVCFNDMSIADETEVKLYFLIGIIDNNQDNQGFRDVLEIANKLYIGLFNEPVVEHKFKMERECEIMLQQEDTFPYFIGGMTTTWKLPVTVTEIPTEFD